MTLCTSAVIFVLLLKLVSLSACKEDDPCQTKEGQDTLGLCKRPENCPNSDYQSYTECGNDATGGTLVCCPTCLAAGWFPIISTISRKYSELYAFTRYRDAGCHIRKLSNGSAENVYGGSGGGFGGVDAKPKQITFMAILGYDVGGKNHWGCGGSLISEKFVLTAGHCTYNSEVGPVRRVRLGDLNIDRTDDDAMPQDFDVVQIIEHPDYAPPSKYNDLAVLQLDKRAELTTYVHPASMQLYNNLFTTTYKAAGWGKLGPNKGYSPHLQVLSLERFSNEECNEFYLPLKSRRKLKDGIVNATQICAGHHTKRVDTCEGDSGGPLLFGETVVGVTSFGLACAESEAPGVYTRILPYVPWIASVVWE